MSGRPDVHDEAARRLADAGQRYTTSRRALIEVLAGAGRPLTIPEVLGASSAAGAGLPQSSAYRNLTVLAEAGAVRRLAGVNAEDHGRFELAESLCGHHHHLVCTSCGLVVDIEASPRIEKALDDAATAAGAAMGFVVTGHAMDLHGLCGDCRSDPTA